MATIYYYPNCSTCKKALKHLEAKEVVLIKKDITSETPNKKMLLDIFKKSGLPVKKFFNTSGKIYRERGLKDQVKDMSQEEAAQILSEEGMLIKRPLLIDEDTIIVGYKEADYDAWIENRQ